MLESQHPDVTTFLKGTPKKLIIGGEQVPSLSGKTFTAYNPSDGAALADVYAALAYYYEHQAEIDRTIRQQEDFVAALRQRIPSKLAARRVIAAHG